MNRANSTRVPVVEIDGIPVHDVTFAETVALIVRWAADRSGGYVCTPNVDHIVRQRYDTAFRRALLGARLRVPDGMGIVYGSRIAGRPLSGTVTGRLLPQAIAAEPAATPPALALFGGRPGAAEAAASKLRRAGGHVADAIEPPMGFRIGSHDDDTSVDRLRASGATVVFVGLGAPKQEMWMERHASDLPGTVLVGVGAAIDVLGGRARAAPTWMTRIGLEWAFRLVHEPRRLARRYVVNDPRFFWWMFQERLRRSRAGDRRRRGQE